MTEKDIDLSVSTIPVFMDDGTIVIRVLILKEAIEEMKEYMKKDTKSPGMSFDLDWNTINRSVMEEAASIGIISKEQAEILLEIAGCGSSKRKLN